MFNFLKGSIISEIFNPKKASRRGSRNRGKCRPRFHISYMMNILKLGNI